MDKFVNKRLDRFITNRYDELYTLTGGDMRGTGKVEALREAFKGLDEKRKDLVLKTAWKLLGVQRADATALEGSGLSPGMTRGGVFIAAGGPRPGGTG